MPAKRRISPVRVRGRVFFHFREPALLPRYQNQQSCERSFTQRQRLQRIRRCRLFHATSSRPMFARVTDSSAYVPIEPTSATAITCRSNDDRNNHGDRGKLTSPGLLLRSVANHGTLAKLPTTVTTGASCSRQAG